MDFTTCGNHPSKVRNFSLTAFRALSFIILTSFISLDASAQLLERGCRDNARVSGLDSDLLSETELLLSWNDMPNALEYEVTIKVHGPREPERVMRLTNNSIYVNDLPDGKVVHWNVKAFCTDGEVSINSVPDTFGMPDMEFRCGDLLVDMRDQRYYRTVQMGSQCWTKDNAFYNLGDDVFGFSIGAGCTAPWKVGGFYSWTAAKMIDSLYTKSWYAAEAEQGICPLGWHIPTANEYDVLFSDTTITLESIQPGGESGFELAFGGFMNTLGNFVNAGKGTILLSSTESDIGRMWAYVIDGHFTNEISKGQIVKHCRGAIRCIKD